MMFQDAHLSYTVYHSSNLTHIATTSMKFQCLAMLKLVDFLLLFFYSRVGKKEPTQANANLLEWGGGDLGNLSCQECQL